LIAKKTKELIPTVAKEINVSEELVKDVVDFYYKKVSDCMINLEEPNIFIKNLGTFKIIYKEITKLYNLQRDHINALNNPDSFKQMLIKKDIEEKHKKLLIISKKVNDNFKERKTHIELKKKLKNEVNRNLEK